MWTPRMVHPPVRLISRKANPALCTEARFGNVNACTELWTGIKTRKMRNGLLIGCHMKIDQENGIQTRNYAARVTRVIDRDLDWLRARVRKRSAWAVRMQRVRDIVVTVMAIVLGSVLGWAVMR